MLDFMPRHVAPREMKMALAGCVPQIFNLLYRRLAVGKALDGHGHRAGCKPAIQQITNLCHIFWSG
jgi:hypothetical protein